ncbi:MAG: hypothetical protein SNI70_11975, partial [Rikenellaceae bacterium]
AGREAIDIKSLEAAIALTEYFRGTAQKVLDFIYGSEFDKLNEQQKTLVSALPESFTTAEGMVIALRCGVPERTFKRFIMTSPLFRKEKHGYFIKVM